MYFAVSKMTFASQPERHDDTHAFRALSERIRSRFKVCVAVYPDASGVLAIVVAALASSEERLSQTLDKIAAFCEESGFGRVESEDALLDHVDHLAEFTAEGGPDLE